MKKSYIFLIAVLFVLSSCAKYDSSFDIGAYSNGEVLGGDQYTEYGENPFVETNYQAVSTFSVDADGASYANCKRYVQNGEIPPRAAVRVEEFINFFSYEYQEPIEGNPISIESELSGCPWNLDHQLLRIGIKGKNILNNQLPASNIVLLVDVSGSMSAEDKLPMLRETFKILVDNFDSNDKIAIVTYSGSSEVHLKPTYCSDIQEIKRSIDKLKAGGSTAGASGINIAYELAEEYFIEGGNNRVILATDGDFNVGISNTEELIELIEEKRDNGVFLTVLGVGRGNLNDGMMEQLADHGNGNFEYIGDEGDARKIFDKEFNKFYTVAQDVKIQLTFNTEAVLKYRLIGYENRSLNAEDFDDDLEDAGEIGCDQSITALYEIIPVENKTGIAIGNMDIRYKLPVETESNLLEHQILNTLNSFEEATESQKFAASVVAYGLFLKNSEYDNDLTLNDILDWSQGNISYDPHNYKEEFIELVEDTKSLFK